MRKVRAIEKRYKLNYWPDRWWKSAPKLQPALVSRHLTNDFQKDIEQIASKEITKSSTLLISLSIFACLGQTGRRYSSIQIYHREF